MGFFDKVKHFAGGHGVTVVITEIENQEPEGATLPLRDSILKGRIQVSGEKEVEILNHSFKLEAIYETDGEFRSTELSEEVNEGEITGMDYSWPYTLQPGQTVDDSFCLGPFDLTTAMEELELPPDAALTHGDLKIVLTVVADVKGSPMDANAKQQLTIVEGGGSDEDYSSDSYDDDDDGDDDADLPEIPVRSQSLPLDPRPYRERFEEMLAELQAHPQIQVTEVDIRDPAPADVIDGLAAEHAVPPAVRAFYEEMNGLTIRWEIPEADGAEAQWGNINILPISDVYGDWKGVVWFDEDWDDGSNKPMHPIDYFIDEAYCGLFLDGSENPGVYYMDDNAQTLEVDFAGYLELLLKSRGYWYWPKALVTDLTGDEYTIEPGNFRRNMPKLFSDYDPSFFLRRKYEDQDEAADEEREEQISELRLAFDAQGVQYSIDAGSSGYIDINLNDSPENFGKASAAMESMGMSTDFEGDWGAMSVGTYMFQRVS